MPARETVSDLFLETLHKMGLRYLFANMGTDYPPIIESLAKYETLDVPLPQVVLCPHENTAITAAHGYALATGQGQGVFVHVGVGTQNLGGALHNAWVSRIPMFIFAGKSPLATRGELTGSRDNFIHYLQDVQDQASVLREYTKWVFNLEIPEQAAYAFQRGVRMMQSEPQGAVYVTAAREVLSEPAPEREADPAAWSARPTLGGLPPEAAQRLAEGLLAAERPLIVCSYAGRNPEALGRLVQLSEAVGAPVTEPSNTYINFPRNHPHHWGFRNSGGEAEADLILLIDTDVPWLPKYGAPKPDTPVVQIDLDPLKPHITLWDFPVTESFQADSCTALGQILGALEGTAPLDEARRQQRQAWIASHAPKPPAPPPDGKMTAASVSALLSEAIPREAVIYDEAVSNSDFVRVGCPRSLPGTYFGLPGGSLGWAGGAAFGHKLARPEDEVVAIIGDGAFFFTVPSSLYMTAQRYGVPFLSVIYNNGGWRAVKLANKRVYGNDGHATDRNNFQHGLAPTDNLEQVAAGFGCYTAKADNPEAFRAALAEGREAVAAGRCAVINAIIEE